MGVFIAFRLSAKRDDRVSRENRRAESVAAIVTAAMALPRRSASWSGFLLEPAAVEFTHAALLFAAREVNEHRDVAEWVLVRHQRISAMWHSGASWLPLSVRRRLVRRLAHEMGDVAGKLVEWNGGLRPSSWFGSDLVRERGGG